MAYMPMLRNAWYAAGWSDEVEAGKLFARKFLNENVVLYRTPDNGMAALQDRCPHRFAPLSYGKLDGGVIECCYHGLCYDSSGACVSNPHGRLPGKTVKTYPVQEKHKLIWIWMGDAKADPAAIPDLSYLDDAPATAFNKGYLNPKCNYFMLVENIMDLSHVDFLHPNTLAAGGVREVNGKKVGTITGAKQTVEEDGAAVTIEWALSDSLPLAIERKHPGLAPSGLIDRRSIVRWDPAGAMTLKIISLPKGCAADEAFVAYNTHLMTPETDTKLHYFFANARSFAQDDVALNEAIRKLREMVFVTEDMWVCEAAQDRIGSENFWDLRPIVLPTDVGAVRVRRKLEAMIADEAAQAATKKIDANVAAE
jgi:nitrite reductase/ring-hydroxylating ferredoxin subunit